MTGTEVVVLGGDDYDFHRLERQGPLIAEILRAHAGVDADLTTDRDVLLDLGSYDALIDYTTSAALTDDQWEGLDAFVAGGGGYVGLHCASAVEYDTDDPQPGLRTLVGGAFRGHAAFGRLQVEVVDRDHPITEGIDDYAILDEPYEIEVDDAVRLLARASHEETGELPVAWTKGHGDGRVFYCSHGHDERAFVHPTFQRLLVRGVEWVVG